MKIVIHNVYAKNLNTPEEILVPYKMLFDLSPGVCTLTLKSAHNFGSDINSFGEVLERLGEMRSTPAKHLITATTVTIGNSLRSSEISAEYFVHNLLLICYHAAHICPVKIASAKEELTRGLVEKTGHGMSDRTTFNTRILKALLTEPAVLSALTLSMAMCKITNTFDPIRNGSSGKAVLAMVVGLMMNVQVQYVNEEVEDPEIYKFTWTE